jgi:DNA transposase THAP9
MLHDCYAQVYSITFDGEANNISMCKELGANFEYGSTFKLYFTNLITQEKCFVSFDPCHMIKLVRNTLGNKKSFENCR